MDNAKNNLVPAILVDGVPVLYRTHRADARASGVDPLFSASIRTHKNGAGRPGLHTITVEIVVDGSHEVETGPRLTSPEESTIPAAKPAPPAPAPRRSWGAPLPEVDPYTQELEPEPITPGDYEARYDAPPEMAPAPRQRHYKRNEWRVEWPVNFGKHSGLTLEQVLAAHGVHALTEYFWRGQDQIQTHTDPANPKRKPDWAEVNRSMCDYILELWQSRGVNTPFARPAKAPSRRGAGNNGRRR